MASSQIVKLRRPIASCGLFIRPEQDGSERDRHNGGGIEYSSRLKGEEDDWSVAMALMRAVKRIVGARDRFWLAMGASQHGSFEQSLCSIFWKLARFWSRRGV
jgi:hypothetical protein